MCNKSNLPQRKHHKMKNYDYSLPGYYYVTICVNDSGTVLSQVGQGLAPAETTVKLTDIGKIAEEQLVGLNSRFSHVRIDRYIIMPNHIHLIIELIGDPIKCMEITRPDLYEIIGTYKSITTRVCNKVFNTPGRKLFQTSFYESVIRSEQGYYEAYQYIEGNPARWIEKYGQ